MCWSVSFARWAIADTEFTDDISNTGGRIHLLQRRIFVWREHQCVYSFRTGAHGHSTTPSLLYSYDMVMFPARRVRTLNRPPHLTNLLNYANAGGRGLYKLISASTGSIPLAITISLFLPVANWSPESGLSHPRSWSRPPSTPRLLRRGNASPVAAECRWLRTTYGQIQISHAPSRFQWRSFRRHSPG